MLREPKTTHFIRFINKSVCTVVITSYQPMNVIWSFWLTYNILVSRMELGIIKQKRREKWNQLPIYRPIKRLERVICFFCLIHTARSKATKLPSFVASGRAVLIESVTIDEFWTVQEFVIDWIIPTRSLIGWPLVIFHIKCTVYIWNNDITRCQNMHWTEVVQNRWQTCYFT